MFIRVPIRRVSVHSMKILIITNSYPPEIRSTSHLMYELATELHDRGQEVTVLTSFPGYNLADPKIRNDVRPIMTENGVTVLRAKTLPLKKVGYLLRGIAEVSLPFNLRSLLKKHSTDYDVIWVFSPPLPLALLGEWIKKRCKGKMVLNAQDIFPQNGIDLGIINNRAAILWYEAMEHLAYRFSDKILVHSEGNRKFLIEEKGAPASKIITQHNWVDTEPFDRAERTGRFRKKYGLNDEVVVLFGGVMGPSQGLDVVMDMADRFRDDKDLVFLLVGDGSEKSRLQSEAERRGIKNVLFRPFVSRDEYPYLVKDADIGLVCLSEQVKTPVVPGKIQGYMAAGTPILGIMNKESDGHALIREAKSGIAVRAGDIEGAVKAIRQLRSNPDLRKRMGQSGYAYACQKLSKKACVDNILQLMYSLR